MNYIVSTYVPYSSISLVSSPYCNTAKKIEILKAYMLYKS